MTFSFHSLRAHMRGTQPHHARRLPQLFGVTLASGAALAGGLISCDDSPTGATAPVMAIAFSESELALGTGRSQTLQIQNTGTRPVGPIELVASSVTDAAGNVVPGSSLAITPTFVPTLNAGQAAQVTVSVAVGDLVQSGQYRGDVTARAGSDASASVGLNFVVTSEPTVEISALSITNTATSVRQGDVLELETEVLDPTGAVLTGLPIMWSVSPASSGFVNSRGQLVGYAAGPITVTASYADKSDSHSLTLTARGLSGTATRIGGTSVDDRHTSDLWVHGTHAYTGTWGQRVVGGTPRFGDQLLTWDVSNPADPIRTNTLPVEARTVNDIKVRADGALAMLTHEASNDGLNGVTVLDLSDPAAPVPVSRFTTGLESGIHNVWLEGDYAYLVLDGNGNGLRIMDLSDPTQPTVVASYYAGSSFLHDVYVRDGIAFLSHWNAGLILLDVGNGIAGGSPTNPVEISRLSNLGGQTHNAWYWPEAGYVFVGEEDFSTPGHMRVIDVRDLRNPEFVATFAVPGATPHNFWLDEATGVAYLAWYENGLRALDVSGTLVGELDRQGREIFGVKYDGVGTGCQSVGGTCSWAPQLHNGLVYVSDMNSGLVVLQPSF